MFEEVYPVIKKCMVSTHELSNSKDLLREKTVVDKWRYMGLQFQLSQWVVDEWQKEASQWR